MSFLTLLDSGKRGSSLSLSQAAETSRGVGTENVGGGVPTGFPKGSGSTLGERDRCALCADDCLPQCGYGTVCRAGRLLSQASRVSCHCSFNYILFNYIKYFPGLGRQMLGFPGPHLDLLGDQFPPHLVHGKLCQK